MIAYVLIWQSLVACFVADAAIKAENDLPNVLPHVARLQNLHQRSVEQSRSDDVHRAISGRHTQVHVE